MIAVTPAPPEGRSPPPVGDRQWSGPAESRSAMRSVVEVVAVGLVVMVAGLAFVPVFAGGALLVLLLAAAVPVVVTLALARARRPARLVAGLVAWTVVTAVAAYGSPGDVASLLGGLRDGVQRLFTTALPADAGGDELAVVLFLVGAASTAGCELALGRRQGLLPVVPPVLLLGAALVAGAGGRTVPTAVPGLTAAGVATFALLRSTWRAGRAHERMLVGVGVAAGVAVVAVAAGPRLPGAGARSRYDPRTAYDPVVPRPAVSPLVGFADSFAPSGDTVFWVRAGPGAEQWRLTTLDHFDGQLWTSAAAFRRAGRVLPGDPEVRVATEDLDQEVTIDRLEGYFLPAADRPAEVSVPGLGVDPASGTLLVPRDRSTPRRYRVVSKLARRGPVQLRLAEAVTPDEGDAAAPQLPPPLQQLAEQATRDSPSKMAALQQHFRGTGFTYDATPQAPSGHSLFHISELVSERRGTAEQYASAFAVLARSLGYESRVAVGYRPGERDEATSTYRVRSTDLHAWPEVHFKDIGWVPFEPSPLGQLAGPAEDQVPTPLPAVEQAVRDELSDKGAGPRGGRDRDRPDRPSQADRGPRWLLVATMALAVLALCAPLALVGAKAIRRRRWRRVRSPAGRVLGAWNEVVDRLTERRVRVSPAMTADEVVVASTSLVPATSPLLRSLSLPADTALYAGTDVGPDLADAAWSWAREAAAELHRGVPWWQRLRASLSPAPLLRPFRSRGHGPLNPPAMSPRTRQPRT